MPKANRYFVPGQVYRLTHRCLRKPTVRACRKALQNALRVPGAHVHLYGKHRSAPGRKMGHVTALGPTLPEAAAIAQRAAACIRFDCTQ